VPYQFVQVNDFQANSAGWALFGNVASVEQVAPAQFQLRAEQNDVSLMLYALSDRAFRVRFNPAPGFDYSTDNSLAVVQRELGPVDVQVLRNDGDVLELALGYLTIQVQLRPYQLSVYRGGQLIHQDVPGDGGSNPSGQVNQNLVYALNGPAVANLKQAPTNAAYCGFGEKAGSQLLKNGFTMTFFNYNNFEYATGPVPAGNEGGPLNPSEALYNSIPVLVEHNPQPTGPFAGSPYAYALFLDNPSQSYFNIGANDYSDMDGRYYFGALYGELDYYFMGGDDPAAALRQYVTLTGTAPLPPVYALGFHQGCYGYLQQDLLTVAEAYRKWEIPIDGLHIDVDFQNNYRTFTSSDLKFPQPAEMFALLRGLGFKCSTNITGMVTANPYDETGAVTPYETRDSGRQQNAFIYDTVAEGGESPNLFVAQEQYGQNFGTNPYPYPAPDGSYYMQAATPNPPKVDDLPPAAVIGQTLQANAPFTAINLGTSGFYPDMGQPAVQAWWGQQYQYLLDIGIEMIWQDMTCPAMAGNYDNQDGNYIQSLPLDLMMSYFGEYRPNAEIHNAFALNLLNATYQGLRTLRPDRRPFIIARGGYAGVQRYASLWTGDSASSWDFLRINIPEVLNFGLSGVPITGCDVGGFASGTGCVPYANGGDPQGVPDVVGGTIQQGVCNYELFTRWVTMGALLPWFRIHYDGYNKQFQEPFMYGSPVPENCRLFVQIRYRLIQVLYDAMYRCTQDGMPIARALLLNFPADPGVFGAGGYWLASEFMVGDSILVAPILDPAETADPPSSPQRDLYLPTDGQTQWYAFQNDQYPLLDPVPGGTVVENYYAPLGNGNLSLVPIYVRAGAILPMRSATLSIDPAQPNPITFDIYPGADSSYQLYLDDGETMSYADGAYRLVTVSHHGITSGQQVDVVRTYDNYTPPEAYFYVAFLGTRPPASVNVNGQAAPNIIRSTPEEAAQALAGFDGDAYYYNEGIATTFVKVMDAAPALRVVALW
jgi:alpha-glucosidase